MKRILYLVVLFMFFLHGGCSAKEIKISGWGNPKISQYISPKDVMNEITSERIGNEIIPSFRITLKKRTDGIIKYFKFRTIYHYGQEYSFTDEYFYTWTGESSELQELNVNGTVTITRILPRMEREALIKKDAHKCFIYQEPDGEDLVWIFHEIVIEPLSKKKK
jgi:hypothetical protein